MLNIQEIRPIVENYLSLGYSLIPILPDTKKPPIKWKKFQTEKAGLETVMKWVNNGWWLAGVTGEISGFFVIDDDRIKHGKEEWGFNSTIISQSKSGGRHYQAKYDREVKSFSNPETHIDIKGRRSYVLLPPFDGRKWIKEPTVERVAALPSLTEETEMFIRFKRGKRKPSDIKYLGKEENRELLRVDDGNGRRDSFHSLACSWLQLLPENIAMKRLEAEARLYNPPLTEDERDHNIETAKTFIKENPNDPGIPVVLDKNSSLAVEKNDDIFKIESVTELLNVEFGEEEWLIDEILPLVSIVDLTGVGGTFKTFMAMEAARSVTTGTSFLGRFATKRLTRVLFIDKENGRKRFQKRIKGLGMGGEDIYRIFYPEFFRLADAKQGDGLSEFAKTVAKFVKENKIGLIVVDSLIDLIEGDDNSAKDTQVFFDQIRVLFPETCILILHHEGKDTDGKKSAMDKGRGSTNIPDQCDVVFRVEKLKMDHSKIKMEHAKSRDTEPMTPIIIASNISIDVVTKKTTVKSLTYVKDLDVDDTDPKHLGAIEMIQAMLPGEFQEPMLLKEDIVSRCAEKGISEETTKSAMEELYFKKVMDSKKVGLKGYGNKKKFFLATKPTIFSKQHLPYNED